MTMVDEEEVEQETITTRQCWYIQFKVKYLS